MWRRNRLHSPPLRADRTGRLDGICKVVGVLDYRVDLAFEYTADLLVGHLRNRLEIVDQVLNSCLGFVRQLVAVARKNLNAVVLKGVVACGNDNTRICLVLDGEESDRRRRDNAEQLYIRANRADAPRRARSPTYPRIRGCPLPISSFALRPCADSCVSAYAAAAPILNASSASSSEFATPRTPSVPKYLPK